MSAASRRATAPLRYLVLSGLSFSVNLGITAASHELLGATPELAFAVALVTVFLMNFAAMRWWIFPGSERRVVPQLLGFGVSSAVFRGLEYCAYLLLLRAAGVPYLIAATATIGVSFVAKYFFYASWLFSRSRARP